MRCATSFVDGDEDDDMMVNCSLDVGHRRFNPAMSEHVLLPLEAWKAPMLHRLMIMATVI